MFNYLLRYKRIIKLAVKKVFGNWLNYNLENNDEYKWKKHKKLRNFIYLYHCMSLGFQIPSTCFYFYPRGRINCWFRNTQNRRPQWDYDGHRHRSGCHLKTVERLNENVRCKPRLVKLLSLWEPPIIVIVNIVTDETNLVNY